MKTLLIALTAALTLGTALADTAPVQGKKKPPRLTKEKLQAMQMKRFGGIVTDTRNQRGSIVVVNAQSSAKAEWFTPVIDEIKEFVHVKFEVKDGAFDFADPKVEGSACVFVIDDPKMPMALVAPESRWTMFNIAKIKSEKPAFFEARVKKMLVRSLAYLMGAADSQYPMCLTGCVTKPEDLDQFPMTTLPVDVLGKMEKYIAGYGVTPWKRATYKQSVHEGWGAQPTNEFQKAIWDEIHTLPTKPITIEPETK